MAILSAFLCGGILALVAACYAARKYPKQTDSFLAFLRGPA